MMVNLGVLKPFPSLIFMGNLKLIIILAKVLAHYKDLLVIQDLLQESILFLIILWVDQLDSFVLELL